MQERVPRATARLEPRKRQFNGLDQSMKKMTASIKERRYVTVTTSKTGQIGLKTKKNN